MASTNHLCSMGRGRWKPWVWRLVSTHRRTGSQRLSCWSLTGTCLLPPIWVGEGLLAGRDPHSRCSKVARYTAGLGTQFLNPSFPAAWLPSP